MLSLFLGNDMRRLRANLRSQLPADGKCPHEFCLPLLESYVLQTPRYNCVPAAHRRLMRETRGPRAHFDGPFDFPGRVMRAVRVLTDPRAGVRVKASSVTVSTVGLVPEIERFCEDAGNGASLAISLHAVTDEVRDKVWFRGFGFKLGFCSGVCVDKQTASSTLAAARFPIKLFVFVFFGFCGRIVRGAGIQKYPACLLCVINSWVFSACYVRAPTPFAAPIPSLATLPP